MFFSKLTQREKYFLYVSIAVISLVFFDKAVFSPIISFLDSLNRKTFDYEEELKDSLMVLDKEEYITDNYSKKIGSLDKVSSDEEEIAAMSSEIEQLARKVSVLIQSIKPLSPEGEDLYVKYRIDLDVEANMSQLIDFIYQLEKSQKLYRVKRLSLAPQKKDTTALRASLLITKIAIP